MPIRTLPIAYCNVIMFNGNSKQKYRAKKTGNTKRSYTKKKISNNYKYQRAHCTRNLTECNNGVSTHREIQNLLNTRYRCCMKHIFLFSISSCCHSAFAILFERLSDAVLRLLALHTLRIVVFFFNFIFIVMCVCFRSEANDSFNVFVFVLRLVLSN